MIVFLDLNGDLLRVSLNLSFNFIDFGVNFRWFNVLVALSLLQKLVKDDLIEAIDVSLLIIVDKVHKLVSIFNIAHFHIFPLLDELTVKHF